jgi:hypothetical protein
MSEVKTVNGKRTASPEYRSWQMMKNRCLNTNARDYAHYGGRGIKVCQRWLSFENFLADMGRRPTPKHTLDRKNSNGNYNPSNCRWATRLEQTRNRAYCATKAWELAEQLGVSTKTAHHMIWQLRAKDRGDTRHFELSCEREQTIRKFLYEVNNS